MIFDVTVVIVLGCHEPCPYKMTNLIDKCVCSDCSIDQLFPHISLSSWASLFPETHNIEVRPIYKPIMASKCPREKRSCTTLTLNQKLEVIKPSEEDMLKARIG